LISEMAPHAIWKSYVLYIGAGAVATGGIISLIQSLPTIVRSAVAGFRGMGASRGGANSGDRTARDLSMGFVLVGSVILVLAIWLTPSLKMNLFGAVLMVLFGFLFVTVSSRLTGEIGSSSNPISGMTVATLLLTSLIFLLMGWVSGDYRVTALSVAAVVCVAASNGGTTSQDLKTGYLVGATPRSQQIALLFGVLSSALVIGFTLHALNGASTIYSKKIPQDIRVENLASLVEVEKVGGPEGKLDTAEYRVLRLAETPKEGSLSKLAPGKYLVDATGVVRYSVDPGINGVLQTRDDGSAVQKFEAPKARLMSLIIDGILTQKLPWGLVLLGVALALVMELLGVSSLPFAVGVYLPISASVPVFIGGLVRYAVDRFRAPSSVGGSGAEAETESSPGVLLSSGLIAGGSISGIALAILSVQEGWAKALDFSGWLPAVTADPRTAVVVFGAMAAFLFWVGRSPSRSSKG
jgi:uncharacterized oligopeptide transporter (OPT) family protein